MKYLALTLFLILFRFNGLSIWSYYESQEIHEVSIFQQNIKSQGFIVLRDKCNVCHATKKRTEIFTLENMDSLAKEIHMQVFIKKKMPKGRKVKLTDEECQLLQNWLSTVIEITASAN